MFFSACVSRQTACLAMRHVFGRHREESVSRDTGLSTQATELHMEKKEKKKKKKKKEKEKTG